MPDPKIQNEFQALGILGVAMRRLQNVFYLYVFTEFYHHCTQNMAFCSNPAYKPWSRVRYVQVEEDTRFTRAGRPRVPDVGNMQRFT